MQRIQMLLVRGRRQLAVVGVACLALALSASQALASGPADPTIDYSKITDPAKTEVNKAILPAVIFLGLIAALFIGLGIFRKVTGAKKPPA